MTPKLPPKRHVETAAKRARTFSKKGYKLLGITFSDETGTWIIDRGEYPCVPLPFTAQTHNLGPVAVR